MESQKPCASGLLLPLLQVNTCTAAYHGLLTTNQTFQICLKFMHSLSDTRLDCVASAAHLHLWSQNQSRSLCFCTLCRFFPDGQFVYRTSPDVIRNTVRSLQLSPGKVKADAQVETGVWRLNVGLWLHCICVCMLSVCRRHCIMPLPKLWAGLQLAAKRLIRHLHYCRHGCTAADCLHPIKHHIKRHCSIALTVSDCSPAFTLVVEHPWLAIQQAA